MINHKHKFIFLHVPKTGGTSIENMFNKNYHSNQQHHSLAWHKNRHSKIYEEYFKFSIIRNPYDKVISEYLWHKNDPLKQFKNKFKGLSLADFLGLFFSIDKTFFEDKKWSGWFPMHFETHRIPQTLFLDPISDLDFVIRFENLHEDFNKICDKTGIPKQQLPHKNKAKRKHYTEYYDDETREIVAQKYAKDIEYFGYKFEA